jgi:hypothetical protein
VIAINKKIVLPVLAAVLATGAVVFAGTTVYAETVPNGYPSLVQKIADRFKLNVSDVQAVFDQNRQDRQQMMQQKFDDRLTKAVTDGKITDAQKQLILAKEKELQQKRKDDFEKFKTMTADQRKQILEQEKTDLDAWAKANGIDTTYLLGPGRGFGRGMMHWNK